MPFTAFAVCWLLLGSVAGAQTPTVVMVDQLDGAVSFSTGWRTAQVDPGDYGGSHADSETAGRTVTLTVLVPDGATATVDVVGLKASPGVGGHSVALDSIPTSSFSSYASALAYQQTLVSVASIPSGTHTVTVTTAEGYLWIDAFRVTTTPIATTTTSEPPSTTSTTGAPTTTTTAPGPGSSEKVDESGALALAALGSLAAGTVTGGVIFRRST